MVPSMSVRTIVSKSAHLAVRLEAADVYLYLAPGRAPGLALLLALVAGLALAGHWILLVHTPAMRTANQNTELAQ